MIQTWKEYMERTKDWRLSEEKIIVGKTKEEDVKFFEDTPGIKKKIFFFLFHFVLFSSFASCFSFPSLSVSFFSFLSYSSYFLFPRPSLFLFFLSINLIAFLFLRESPTDGQKTHEPLFEAETIELVRSVCQVRKAE